MRLQMIKKRSFFKPDMLVQRISKLPELFFIVGSFCYGCNKAIYFLMLLFGLYA